MVPLEPAEGSAVLFGLLVLQSGLRFLVDCGRPEEHIAADEFAKAVNDVEALAIADREDGYAAAGPGKLLLRQLHVLSFCKAVVL